MKKNMLKESMEESNTEIDRKKQTNTERIFKNVT